MKRPTHSIFRTFIAVLGLALCFAHASLLCAHEKPSSPPPVKPGETLEDRWERMGLTGEEKAWLEKHPIIRVAYDGYFPPYSYLTEGGIFQGLAVDVTNRIAGELGITLRVYPSGLWKDLYDAAKRREVDLVATMVDRPERREWFLFTQPYIFKSLVIMTRKDDTRITRREEIAGKTVAVVRGYQYVKRITEEFPSIVPYPVDTMRDGLNAVATGKADAAITFISAGHYLLMKYGISNVKFAVVYDRDTSKESFAVRKDRPELASILGKALTALGEDKLRAINQKWQSDTALMADLKQDILSPTGKKILIVLASLLGGAVLVLLIFSGWNRTLRRRVGLKTRELEESAEKFQAIFEQAAVGVAQIVSKTGDFVRINQKYADIVGYTIEEMKNLTFQEITHPDDLQTDMDNMKRLIDGTIREFSMEKRYYHKNGSVVWVNLNVSPMWKIGEEPNFHIAVVEDITARKQAEEALHETQRQLLTLMNNLPGMVYRCKNDPEWTMDFVSDGCEALTGYKSKELVGNGSVSFGKLIHPKDRQRVWDSVQSALEIKQPYRLNYRIIAADGEEKWAVGHGQGVFGKEGDLVFLEGLIMDISRRRKAEEKLQKQQQLLEQRVKSRTKELDEAQKALLNVLEDVQEAKTHLEAANLRLQELDRLKSMFIASMSHELRTPLNSIIGFTGILLQGLAGDLNDEQRDQLRRVSGAGKHLLALINDVIDISKIEAGKTDRHVTEFELATLVTDAVDQFGEEIKRKGLDLQVAMAGHVKLKTDRRRLLQCLLNFLSNAFKFTEKGSIVVETAAALETVEIRVRDTGIGIKEEDLPRLFQSFVRLDSHLRNTVPGTGLGLYLTRKITEEILGGSVFVESREGAGSTFGVRVPRELPE